MREAQRARGEKTRYDGRWRDRTDSRPGVDPVIRFRNPLEGEVVVEDLVSTGKSSLNAVQALREGWDNPNVFQICALREMASERNRSNHDVIDRRWRGLISWERGRTLFSTPAG